MLFYKNYIVYYNVYCDYLLKSMCSPRLVAVSVSYMPIYVIYVPAVMYGLRLFIVVLQELHCLPNCLHVGFNRDIGFYHFTRFPCSILSSF